ncbi:unnamed protein product, partial [Toxocara canis]|uniref:Tyrosine-protein phosphatase domain-containing protein n=1 Tax=Toxocara canis TaxID=6265 RepID=A0A183VCP5_TOXCA
FIIVKHTSNGSTSDNRAVDGEQRCVACEGAEKFFKKMLNKSAAEIALKGEHKTLVKKARHISEFCKSLSDLIIKNLSQEGRNRYAHMVNFNECALRLEPTVPGDVKYIHASRIRHAYGNFILAQGPTRRTLVDFYRLVWLNRIRLIVCVDPLVNPRNCVHYFEFNVSKTFKAEETERFQVGKRFTVLTCKATTTETSNLTIYELYMSNKELKSGATGRRIILLHYNAWEVLKPPTARTLLEIIKCVRTLETPSRGSLHPDPILVHGSCGVRRSGILALTSILCNQVSLTQKLSIVRTAIEIRRIRYGVLRSRLGFLIVLEAVLLHASTIGVLDPRAKVRDALAVRLLLNV